MDFFQQVGVLGLGSRLKRLSDVCMSEVRQIYSNAGLDFDPKLFPLFFILQEQGSLTVTEAARQLDLTHPHISQLVKEILKAKVVAMKPNPEDGRSRILILTPKGKNL